MTAEHGPYGDMPQGEHPAADIGAASTGKPGQPYRFKTSVEGFVGTVRDLLKSERGRDMMKQAREKGHDVVARLGREPTVYSGEGIADTTNAVRLSRLRKTAEVSGAVAITALTALVIYKHRASRGKPKG